ncbi:hypothetical protein GWK47_013202 [Chionoecetes opilio]|uniref:Uncharacterized protein n=1 Tax=Chionoecetes opilio TaxID=41210 RepID=A0A8J5CP24_CHIOP|nr:hypothetical protein GWK47_013202 [Chionoecetes opilio]
MAGPLSRPPRDIQIAFCCLFRSRSSAWRPVSTFICLPGSCRGWRMCGADALSRFRGSSVEWQLRPERFAAPLGGGGALPGVDLFPVPPLCPKYRPLWTRGNGDRRREAGRPHGRLEQVAPCLPVSAPLHQCPPEGMQQTAFPTGARDHGGSSLAGATVVLRTEGWCPPRFL